MNKEIKSIYRADFFAPCPTIAHRLTDWIAEHNSGILPISVKRIYNRILAHIEGLDDFKVEINEDNDSGEPTEISIHYMGVLAILIRLHQVYDFAGIEAGIMTLKQEE